MMKTNFLIFVLFLVVHELFGQFERITNSELVLEEFRSLRSVWGDFDNNSYPDIYIQNYDTANSLFLNNGDETFTKILVGSIVTDEISTSTVSKADINNDGFLDLFVSGGSYNSLYLGIGDGTFTKSTTTDILTSGGTSVSWGDYDRDGDLDAAISKNSGTNTFFENNGDGSFTEVVSSAFSTVSSSYSSWIDINNDGFLDIYAIDWFDSPNLFINNGDKTFTKDSENAIVTGVSHGENQSWGDYNNDGYLDLFIGRSPGFPNEGNRLFQNNGDGTFTSVENSKLIISETNEYVEGSNWADYDNDGFLDIYLATSTGRSRLFHNNGDGTFNEITGDFLDNSNYAYRYSANWADYNNDGFVDLFSAVAASAIERSPNDNNILLKNLQNSNHWLNISLRGSENNFFGVGAKITGYRGNWISSKRIIENGFGVSDFRENFGVGKSFGLDSLVIEWPTGDRQVLKNVLSNNFLEVHEDSLYSIPLAPTNVSANALGDNDIELTWEDENDVSEGFLLFISTDSMTFELINTLSASNNSVRVNNLNGGTKYYFNILSTSKSTFSDNSSISFVTPLTLSIEKLSAENIEIFPNPTDDYLTIRNLSGQSLTFSLHSLDGSLILSKELDKTNDSFSVDLQSVRAGIYLATLSAENLITTKRVIKR